MGTIGGARHLHDEHALHWRGRNNICLPDDNMGFIGEKSSCRLHQQEMGLLARRWLDFIHLERVKQ